MTLGEPHRSPADAKGKRERITLDFDDFSLRCVDHPSKGLLARVFP